MPKGALPGVRYGPVCGAIKGNGEPCGSIAARNGRCINHGGRTLVGAETPQFQGGRYSKYLPDRLLERFDQAQNDPELLSVRSEIALLDVRMSELLGRLDHAEGPSWRVHIKKSMDAFMSARSRGEPVEMTAALDTLANLINEQFWPDHLAWQEIRNIVQERAKLSEVERKRLESMKQTMTAEQAATLLAAVAHLVREFLSGEQLEEFERRLAVLLGRSSPEEPEDEGC